MKKSIYDANFRTSHTEKTEQVETLQGNEVPQNVSRFMKKMRRKSQAGSQNESGEKIR